MEVYTSLVKTKEIYNRFNARIQKSEQFRKIHPKILDDLDEMS